MNPLLSSSLRIRSTDGTVREAHVASRGADHAAEWAFVLRNNRTIDKFCRALCKDERLDIDDLRQEATIWIVRNYGSFNPDRAAASTWIYWLCRRARQALLVDLNRKRAREVSVEATATEADREVGRVLDAIANDRGECALDAERKIDVSRLLNSLTSFSEAQACISVLYDAPASDVRATHGSLGARDRELRELAMYL